MTNFVSTEDDRGYCRNMSCKLKNAVFILRIQFMQAYTTAVQVIPARAHIKVCDDAPHSYHIPKTWDMGGRDALKNAQAACSPVLQVGSVGRSPCNPHKPKELNCGS